MGLEMRVASDASVNESFGGGEGMRVDSDESMGGGGGRGGGGGEGGEGGEGGGGYGMRVDSDESMGGSGGLGPRVASGGSLDMMMKERNRTKEKGGYQKGEIARSESMPVDGGMYGDSDDMYEEQALRSYESISRVAEGMQREVGGGRVRDEEVRSEG